MKPYSTHLTLSRLFLFIVLVIILWILVVPHTFAATGIRRTINFQGKIVNKTTGTNIADGTYSFTFKFYDASSAGTQLPSGAAWSETQSIVVTNGIFRAELGSSTVIPTTLDFNADNLYLDITFDGETFGSRVRMTAVPYAFNAEKVGGLTVTNTTGTLTVPNGKTISFADSFITSGANPLTLTTSGTTNATLPSGSITLVDTTTVQTLTNKTIGSTGLTFSGATTDVTTGTDEAFTVAPNGTGDVVISADNDSNFQVTGTVTDTGTLDSVSITLGNDAAADTVSAITVNVTSVDTGADSDVIRGITVANASGANSNVTETALYIGTGYDRQIEFANAAFATCTALETVSGVITCGTDDGATGTLFTLAGDSGSNQTITQADTVAITGGTNGIDTVGTATDSVVLNLDTTEIGTTTFGSGSGITWTFDAGASDPTIAFGSGTIGLTATTTTVTGALSITGVTTIGDAGADTVTLNAATVTAANDTNFVLSGGVNGLSFDTTTLSIDATNDRVGIGTTAPGYKLDVDGGSGLGRIGLDVSGVNPSIILFGDATNGYYPTIDFRPTGSTTTGGAIQSYSTIGGLVVGVRGGPLTIQRTSSSTNSVDRMFAVETATSGTAANGFGARSDYYLEDSAGNGNIAGAFDVVWEDVTDGSEDASLRFSQVINGTLTEAMRVDDGGRIGIGTTAPAAALDLTGTLAADSGTTKNIQRITLTTPADTTGTNVSQGLHIATTIGNATAGTNTANIVNLAAVTGDAQVTLNAVNIGALTGTAAAETAITIGSGWDNVLSVNGTPVINGSGQIISTQVNGTLFTLAGDSGSATIIQGDTATIAGGTNGIDTSHSGDTVTLNLDTTEIGTTTFGSGSGITWTFDAGASDPTIAFGSGTIGLTATTTTVTGALSITGVTTIGDAGADTVTLNAATVTAANDTNFVLSGGVNGLSFDTDTLSIDATNNRVGIGITAPTQTLHVNGRIRTDGGMLFNQGIDATHNLIFVGSESSGEVNASFGFMVAGVGSTGEADGPYFLGRGDTFANIANQRGNMYFSAGTPGTPGTAEGSLNFITGTSGVNVMRYNNAGNLGIGQTTPTAKLHILQGNAADQSILVDAATTDTTSTAGVVDFNIDTTTAANVGLNIDYAVKDAAGNVTSAFGQKLNVTVDTDAAQSHTVTGLNIVGANNDASSTLTALAVDAGTGAGTEYAATFMNGNVGIGLTAPTFQLEVAGTAGFDGNTTIGNANTDTLTITAGTSGTGITLTSFVSCTALETNGSGVLTCGTDDGGAGMTSFTLAGDTGSNQTITDGNTLAISGGTNGIDTVGTATDSVVLNLDTTEIGTTTFGSGSGFTWTFNAGASDPAIAFGSGTITATAVDSLSLTAGTNSGSIIMSQSDGSLEIGSGNNASSYIDFKGSSNLATDYQGRIAYDDGAGFSFYTAGGVTAALSLSETNNTAQFNGGMVFGDASGDSVTFNAATGTYANDTNYVLSGGVNGLSFDTDTLSIDATNNRVGIGITAPTASLQVLGTTSGAIAKIGINNTPAGATTVLNLDVPGNVSAGRGPVIDFAAPNGSGTSRQVATIGGLSDVSNVGGRLVFSTNDSSNVLQERVRIDSSGYVGIGQTTPTRPLHISSSAPDASNGSVVYIDGSMSSTTNNQDGLRVQTGVYPGSASARFYTAVNFTLVSNNGNLAGASMAGLYGGMYYDGTVSVGNSYGAFIQNQNISTGTLTDAKGIYIDNPVNSGGGAITTNTGLHVVNQTRGGTDYGVYIGGADTYALWVDTGVTRLDAGVTLTSFLTCSALETDGSGVLTCGTDDLGGGAGAFTDGGTNIYLTTSTDSVTIGATGEIAKFGIKGDADETQFMIQTFSGQSTDVFVLENAFTTDFFTISSSGYVDIQNLADTTGAFQIFDLDGGAPVFNVDTTNEYVGIGTSGPGSKLDIAGGTITDSGQAVDINLTLGNDAAADTVSGLSIDVTSVDTGADSDVIRALTIGNLSGGNTNVTETGMYVGTGFDRDLEFADTTAVIQFQSGGQLTFDDGTGVNGNSDLPLGRVREYFSTAGYGVFESGGFINIDGSFYMENFLNERVTIAADNTNVTNRFGDNMGWYMDELGTGGTVTNAKGGCVAGQNTSSSTERINGVLEMALETNSNTGGTNLTGPNCYMFMGNTTVTGTNLPPNAMLRVANKFIMYYKMKPGAQFTNTPSHKYLYFGADNNTVGWHGMPTVTHTNKGGMWVNNVTATGSNAAGETVWRALARSGTNNSTASFNCSTGNANIVTSAYALARLEARATNDFRFFVDADVSNGINLEYCTASVTSNIITQQLRPAMNVGNFTSFTNTTGLWTAYVDLFGYVQDDPRDGTGGQVAGLASDEGLVQPPSKPNPIAGADLAEQYIFGTDDEVEAGDIVSLGEHPGQGNKASKEYDRKLLGVVSESPGLLMGEASGETLPVALTGRVPVKVSNKNGAIKIGDPITSSDVSGFGIKATQPGKILGTAMENFNGSSGKILVNINVGYYLGDEGDTALLELGNDAVGLGESMLASMSAKTATESAQVASGSAVLLSEMVESIKDGIFKTSVEFWNKVTFKGVAEYLAEVFFKSNVHFEGQVEFGNDTAGYATIKQGERFVDIEFDKEYKSEPIVNISVSIPRVTDEKFKQLIALGECDAAAGLDVCQDHIATQILADDLKAAVTAKTQQGFIIMLNRHAPVDVTFSWQAVAVKEAKTSVSKSTAELVKELQKTASSSAKTGEVAGEATSSGQLQIRDALERAASESSRLRGDASVNNQKGIIKETELGYVRLRSSSSLSGEELEQIPTGTEVIYIAVENGWYNVTYNGKTGWVSGEYVKKSS